MKILFVNKHMRECGGVEYYIRSLSRRLKRKGAHTFIMHWDEPDESGVFDGASRIRDIWEDEFRITKSARKEIDSFLKNVKPDIVFSHNVENAQVLKYLWQRSKLVQYVHGYKKVDPDGKMLLKNPLEPNTCALGPGCFLRAFTRGAMPRNPVKAIRAYARAKRSLEALKELSNILVASSYMKDILARNGIESRRVEVFPYFVDFEEVPGPATERGRLLFAGRIAGGKGLPILLDILASVKTDFVLDVVGTGPLESRCREKAERLGLSGKVDFHGWVDHSRLSEFYSKAAFLVMPSVWPEPFGICGIEAAYFGKPAVAFNVGGISDWLIDRRTGFLVEPYDKDAMSGRIRELIQNPAQAALMGEKAREKAYKDYMPGEHVQRLMGLFEEVLRDIR
ncbi:MAG: glycosyltransferase [Candidatus Omnitrophica bacterium]|nr:glycosyltransferase [Candidatus Omnitrophota bacterium]